GGGYMNNETEDKSAPAFMAPDGGAKDGSPGYILDSEKVELDDSLFAAGDLVPGIYKAAFTGDRGDISAGWVYADGKWIVEMGRKLVTGSMYDVQFDDMAGMYYFGVATFENAQVRHNFAASPNLLVFKP
ncbi:MAG: ethylbenzene dehydrogenase-related protein, partial [Acidimicrobiia bacterium]|nr:ethylbenzene dehydrogenase-related protein [Acidimicrobiia bacterium]